jgi:hypothetical protein
MQSTYGLARGVLRMFSIMGGLMSVSALAALILIWREPENTVAMTLALVLLVYGVVTTFIAEMASAQLRTAEDTALLMADMQTMLEKMGSASAQPLGPFGDSGKRKDAQPNTG